jgi:hypothetical protein
MNLETEKKHGERGTERDRGRREGEEWDKRGKKETEKRQKRDRKETEKRKKGRREEKRGRKDGGERDGETQINSLSVTVDKFIRNQKRNMTTSFAFQGLLHLGPTFSGRS